MPISPELQHLYETEEWFTAKGLVRMRSGGCCEWCSRPNRRWILTADDETGRWYDPTKWTWVSPFRDWLAPPAPLPETGVFVLVQLSVAHLDHDPTNNNLSNLAHLCRRCHLIHDMRHHLATARRRRDEEVGQLRMEHTA